METSNLNPIEIEDLHKTYVKGLRQQKVVAVRGLDLTVEKGEIFGFVGPNGAGKSTTIKILCHLIRPTSGRVTLMGREVTSPAARKQVGYLPENPSYYDHLTGRELLAFNGSVHGMADDVIRKRSQEVLHSVELEEAAHRPIRTYSKGMVQRLGIAASLIHDPQVLIWDEPMSGLDPIGRKHTADLMLELRGQGKTIFFSTHILADVEQVCDRIGMIVEGKLVHTGRLEDILGAAIQYYHLSFKLDDKPLPVLPVLAKPVAHAGGYHLEVIPADFSEIMRLLLAEGAEIISVEPKRLRLEDIFVTLSKKS